MKETDSKHYKIRTDTTRFLVPLLGIPREIIDTDSFVNAYLYTFDNVVKKYCIILIYTKIKEDFEIKKYPGFNIQGYIGYIFYIDRIVYDRFIKGKYSKFTDEEKQQILKFWNLNKYSRMYSILHPSDYMFELGMPYTHNHLVHNREIWPKPNPFKETFTLN